MKNFIFEHYFIVRNLLSYSLIFLLSFLVYISLPVLRSNLNTIRADYKLLISYYKLNKLYRKQIDGLIKQIGHISEYSTTLLEIEDLSSEQIHSLTNCLNECANITESVNHHIAPLNCCYDIPALEASKQKSNIEYLQQLYKSRLLETLLMVACTISFIIIFPSAYRFNYILLVIHGAQLLMREVFLQKADKLNLEFRIEKKTHTYCLRIFWTGCILAGILSLLMSF